MAEAVGVVSSGFAVVSLALQLVTVSQNLYAFWQSFEDASSEVENIKTHLSTLHAISCDVAEACENEPHIQCGESVVKSLEACKTRVEKLSQVMRKVESKNRDGLWSKTRASLRVTLKEKSIRRIESQLGDDVLLLILALQPFFHRVQQNKIDLVNSNFTGTVDGNQRGIGDSASTKLGGILKNQKQVSDVSGSERRSLGKLGVLGFSQFRGRYLSFKIESHKTVEKLMAQLGVALPARVMSLLRRYSFGLTYLSATHQFYLDAEQILFTNVKRRVRVTLPITAFQLQTSTIPLSITAYPIEPCLSQIFKFCLEGNIDMVKICFQNSWTSPYVVNQHGENLLHAAARYAHAELCNLLLDIGVDGTAYDDRLLTPLDHLARKIGLSLAYPSEVVNTIRALVEKGRCQPLLSVTSNAVAFYSGPEEGFSWLFSSEYGGVDLEERDSEDWTLLGDAAFNFGWWTEYGVDDPAVSWQCLYLLRAGAMPHAASCEGLLTPLDAFLRGCTRNQVENASKWLQVLLDTGVDLHEYAREEQKIHHPEHLLKQVWDEELWKWIPTKQRVVYRLGETVNELEIWLEDYDALSWFHAGRFDLDIFETGSPSVTAARWEQFNAREEPLKLIIGSDIPQLTHSPNHTMFSMTQALVSARWFQILASLLIYHVFYLLWVAKR